jgi:hypothetical protein
MTLDDALNTLTNNPTIEERNTAITQALLHVHAKLDSIDVQLRSLSRLGLTLAKTIESIIPEKVND